LNKALAENRESLRKLRFGLAGSTKSDTQSTKSLKRNVARIMTELRTPTK
jgi:ribosomal protein L29